MKIILAFIFHAFFSDATVIIDQPYKEIWDAPIARKLGHFFNPKIEDVLSKNGNPRFSIEKCVNEFGNYFDAMVEISHGYYGTVFLADGKDGKQYVVKSVPHTLRNLISDAVANAQGINVIEEILIGRTVSMHLARTGKASAFVVVHDWFRCSRSELYKRFCERKCPTVAQSPKSTDATFIVTEYIPGNSVLEYLQGGHIRPGRQLTDFIRSVTFQVLYAFNQAFKELKFAHFDMNFNNVRLEEDPYATLALRDKYFLFKDENREWKVPVLESEGRRARIIDYGISRAEVDTYRWRGHAYYSPVNSPKDYIPIRKILGPRVCDRFTDLQGHQFSLLMFFYFLMSSIDTDTLTEWRKKDSEGYNSFTEVFNLAMGFENMNPFIAKLVGLQPLRKTTRQPSRFGIPSFLKKFLSEKSIKAIMEMRGLLRMTAINGFGMSAFDNGHVTAETLMNKDFYSTYK